MHVTHKVMGIDNHFLGSRFSIINWDTNICNRKTLDLHKLLSCVLPPATTTGPRFNVAAIDRIGVPIECKLPVLESMYSNQSHDFK